MDHRQCLLGQFRMHQNIAQFVLVKFIGFAWFPSRFRLKRCFPCRRKSHKRRTLPGEWVARMAWKVGRAIEGKLILASLREDFAGPGVIYNSPEQDINVFPGCYERSCMVLLFTVLHICRFPTSLFFIESIVRFSYLLVGFIRADQTHTPTHPHMRTHTHTHTCAG